MTEQEMLEFLRGVLVLVNSVVFYKEGTDMVIKTPAAVLGRVAGRLEYQIEFLSKLQSERSTNDVT